MRLHTARWLLPRTVPDPFSRAFPIDLMKPVRLIVPA
jgi:hypothetical protein